MFAETKPESQELQADKIIHRHITKTHQFAKELLENVLTYVFNNTLLPDFSQRLVGLSKA